MATSLHIVIYSSICGSWKLETYGCSLLQSKIKIISFVKITFYLLEWLFPCAGDELQPKRGCIPIFLNATSIHLKVMTLRCNTNPLQSAHIALGTIFIDTRLVHVLEGTEFTEHLNLNYRW